MSGSPPTPEAIARARWYGGKGTAVAAVEELDRLELTNGALSVLAVRDAAGSAQRYLWIEGDVGAALVERVARGGSVGAFSFHPGPAPPPPAPGEGERSIGADQSNTSIVVGERLVVKLYRRLEQGPHPEIELGRHLTANRLDCVPAFAGSVEWSGHAVAVVQELVTGAEDGWTWAGRVAAVGDAEPGRRLGEVTRAIHSALAELGSRPVTAAEQRAWRVAAEAQLERARELTRGAARALLDAHHGRLRGELAELEAPSPSLTMTRVHGDYHVGQVLRAAGGRLVVVDFEGEPGKPLAERSAPGTPLRDVAAMLRSFDHLARSVERDLGPGSRERLERWIDGIRGSFGDGYGAVDERMLRALEIEKECYEFTYAATYLPDWIYAAEGGMRWLMEHGDG